MTFHIFISLSYTEGVLISFVSTPKGAGAEIAIPWQNDKHERYFCPALFNIPLAIAISFRQSMITGSPLRALFCVGVALSAADHFR